LYSVKEGGVDVDIMERRFWKGEKLADDVTLGVRWNCFLRGRGNVSKMVGGREDSGTRIGRVRPITYMWLKFGVWRQLGPGGGL
jgi:hypothetical protein